MREEQYNCKRPVKMGMIEELTAYTVPKTLILVRNAYGTVLLHCDSGATGLERPSRSFEDFKGSKW